MFEDNIYWVILTNACVWLGLGLYITVLAFKQRGLQIRFNRLESLIHEHKR